MLSAKGSARPREVRVAVSLMVLGGLLALYLFNILYLESTPLGGFDIAMAAPVIGLLGFLAAFGLWKTAKWGWQLGMIVAVSGLIYHLLMLIISLVGIYIVATLLKVPIEGIPLPPLLSLMTFLSYAIASICLFKARKAIGSPATPSRTQRREA